jgi:hypothetical protein
VDFSRSRLEAGAAAPLALHFLVTLFDKAFAFAILAFYLRFARILLHVCSDPVGIACRQPVEWNEIHLIRLPRCQMY